VQWTLFKSFVLPYIGSSKQQGKTNLKVLLFCNYSTLTDLRDSSSCMQLNARVNTQNVRNK